MQVCLDAVPELGILPNPVHEILVIYQTCTEKVVNNWSSFFLEKFGGSPSCDIVVIHSISFWQYKVPYI